jgi:hypothetical protein
VSAVWRTGVATGGTANGTVNGFGSRLAGSRAAMASRVRATHSAGSIRAALPKRPSFCSSRRLSSMQRSPKSWNSYESFGWTGQIDGPAGGFVTVAEWQRACQANNS